MVFAPECPICRRPVVWEGNPCRPFCSERCQLMDLGTWASERYRIAGEAVDPERFGEDAVDPDAEEGNGSGRNGAA